MLQQLESKPDVQQPQQQQHKRHQQQQQPPHLQPYHLATVAPNGEQVHVNLSNAATWSKFSRQNTEMIVTKAGRRMFPCLCLDISGLPPAKKYEVYVTLLPADQRTLKYQRGLWIANGQAEAYPPPGCASGLAYLHPDSPASGRHWTKQEVTFMKLKLTNRLDGFDEPGRQGSMIFAYSMHKYLPVVHISELSQAADSSSSSSLEAGPRHPHHQQQQQDRFYTSVVFPGTEFITVTAYQNPELTDLKIQFNPYAKGVRNQTDRSTGLLIDTFRPTVQAMTQRHQQQQQHQHPAGVEFGSYPSQTVSAYGHWQQVGAGSSSRRHQPYSLPAAAATASSVQHPLPHRRCDSPTTAAHATPEPASGSGVGDADKETDDRKNVTASASATSSAAESADSAASAAAAAAATAAVYYQSPHLYQPHHHQHHQLHYSPSSASSAAAAAYYFSQHQHQHQYQQLALSDYEQQQQQARYYALTPPHQEQQVSTAYHSMAPATVGYPGCSEAALMTHQHLNYHHHLATATPQQHLLASSSHVTDSSPSGVSFNSPDL